MAFATDTWSLALLSILPGMLCAPVLSAASEWLTDLVAEKRRGEAMGWYGSALTSGTALGSPITGATVDGFGADAGFIVVGAIGAACLRRGPGAAAGPSPRAPAVAHADSPAWHPGPAGT